MKRSNELERLAVERGGRSLGVVLPTITAKAVLLDDGMTKTEQAYARQLEIEKRAGLILDYAFHPESLRLGERCRFEPDFRVILPDFTVEFREVKGRKGESFWVEEDALIKLRVAAKLHPYRLCVVWPLKGGGWGRWDVNKTAEPETKGA